MSQTILRLPQVKARTGLSRSSVYEKIKSGNFPSQISLGARSIGFLERDVDSWIESRVTQSRNKQSSQKPA